MRTLLLALLLLGLLSTTACGESDDGAPAAPAVATPEPDPNQPPPGDGNGPLDGLEPGPLPDDWTVVEGTWSVNESEQLGTRILQDAKHENRVFNVLLLPEGVQAKDVRITVTVDEVSGVLDQGGGPVWRARDGRNYYIARWNPLEDNFRVYKVVDGVRTQLGGATVAHEPGPHVLRVEMQGETIKAFLDGKLRVELKDTTFPAAGRVGLWTKADARTGFSRLEITPLEAR